MKIDKPSALLLGLAWPALLSLTPGLSANGKVYMTRSQALSRAFPSATSFLERRHVLTKKEKSSLEKKLQRKLSERGYLTWLALDGKGKPLGFVVMTAEVGRTEPFFLMLAMDCNGKLLHIDVLEYREPRGSEVRHQSFLRRFKGVELANAAKKLRKVPVIPGATLSCHSVNRAVKKSLVLHKMYVEQGKGKVASRGLLSVFRKAGAKQVPVKKKIDSSQERLLESEARTRPSGSALRSSLGLPAMGDIAFVELEYPTEDSRIRDALSIVMKVEEELSPRIPTSMMGRANALRVGECLALTDWPLAAIALQDAWEGTLESHGRFSPVPGRRHPELAFRFEDEGRALRRVGFGDLDPGAFGKGFAADLLGQALDEAALSWISAGFRSSFLLAGPAGQHMGVSTSGTTRRGSHLLDPRTGESIQRNGEVQVAAATAFEAEVWSTAWFVEREPDARA